MKQQHVLKRNANNKRNITQTWDRLLTTQRRTKSTVRRRTEWQPLVYTSLPNRNLVKPLINKTVVFKFNFSFCSTIKTIFLSQSKANIPLASFYTKTCFQVKRRFRSSKSEAIFFFFFIIRRKTRSISSQKNGWTTEYLNINGYDRAKRLYRFHLVEICI